MTNLATYGRGDVVNHYGRLSGLFPAEERIIRGLGRMPRVLDLGIGGGRTTGPLIDRAESYVGIDYSSEMIRLAQRRHPLADLRVMDVRDLSDFEDNSFTHVFFLFNGLDYIGHQDRLTALAEIRRVLQPGGTFLFTSHNRDYRRVGKAPWQVDYPLRERVSRSIHYLRHTRTRRRMRVREVERSEYALVNDDAHDYSLLTYYIDHIKQVGQLFRAGFNAGPVFNQEGFQLLFDDTSAWYYYLAYGL